MPDSATVGISGALATRLVLVMARALMLPAFASGSEDSIGSAINCTWPLIKSVKAGLAPL